MEQCESTGLSRDTKSPLPTQACDRATAPSSVTLQRVQRPATTNNDIGHSPFVHFVSEAADRVDELLILALINLSA